MATSQARKRNIGAWGAVLALLATLFGVFAAPVPASAHTGDLHASAECVAGEYVVTYTLTTSSVPSGVTGSSVWRIGNQNFQGTPTSASGMDRGPVASTGNQTVTLGTQTLPGNTTGNGPWVYAWTTWSNGADPKGSDGRVEGLRGNCERPRPEKPSFPPEVEESYGDCSTGDTVVTGTRTTTNYKAVFNTSTWEWDKVQDGEPVVEQISRTLTDAEQAACQPSREPTVVREDVGEPECGAATIQVRVTTTTYTYVYDAEAKTWTEVASEPVVTYETRDLAAEEQFPCTPTEWPHPVWGEDCSGLDPWEWSDPSWNEALPEGFNATSETSNDVTTVTLTWRGEFLAEWSHTDTTWECPQPSVGEIRVSCPTEERPLVVWGLFDPNFDGDLHSVWVNGGDGWQRAELGDGTWEAYPTPAATSVVVQIRERIGPDPDLDLRVVAEASAEINCGGDEEPPVSEYDITCADDGIKVTAKVGDIVVVFPAGTYPSVVIAEGESKVLPVMDGITLYFDDGSELLIHPGEFCETPPETTEPPVTAPPTTAPPVTDPPVDTTVPDDSTPVETTIIEDPDATNPTAPPFCPSGMTGSDTNGNGVVDEGECNTPTLPATGASSTIIIRASIIGAMFALAGLGLTRIRRNAA